MAASREDLEEAARRMLAHGERPTPEALAQAAGVSRSTYFRLVGSHRDFLSSLGWDDGASARERILQAALEMIDEMGVSALGMDLVATRAGTSRATLYRLFANKAELFSALAKEHAPLQALRPLLEQQAATPPADLLPPLLKAGVIRLLKRRGLLRAILAEAAIDTPDTTTARAIVVEAYEALARYLLQQMDAGRLRRVEPAAAVQALLGPVLFYATTRPETWPGAAGSALDPEEMVGEMVAIWLRGMSPAEAAADPETPLA